MIAPVLSRAVSDRRVSKPMLFAELSRNHIKLDDLTELLHLVETAPSLEAIAVAMILDLRETPANAYPFLSRIASSDVRDGELRLRAVTAMARSSDLKRMKTAFSAWGKSSGVTASTKVKNQFKSVLLNSPAMEENYQWLLLKARGGDSKEGVLAWDVLFQLRRKKSGAEEMKDEIDKSIHSVVEKGGNQLLRLVNVIASTGSQEWKEIVISALDNEDERVKTAAVQAAKQLGIKKKAKPPEPKKASPDENSEI